MTPTFTSLPDLADVRQVGVEDVAVFVELREVLQRHDALSRFGVVLLHQHFPLSAHERLVEFVDTERRTLTIRPVSVDDRHAANAIQTQWRLDDASELLACEQWCYEDPATGEHIDTGHQSGED